MQFHLFPYGRIDKNASVVIYGVGNVGQQYINQLTVSNFCKVKYAVDRNYENITSQQVEVCSPERLRQLDYDCIIIACAEKIQADDIKKIIGGIIGDNSNVTIIWDDRVCDVDCQFNYHMINAKLDVLQRIVLSIDSFTRNECIKNNEILKRNKYYDYYKTLSGILSAKQSPYPLCRMGEKEDGGYVMANKFGNDNIAYSFGIGNDISWDNAMAEHGYEIFMYDHTISGPPYSRPEFHFSRQGLSSQNKSMADCKTLEYFMEENGHTQKNNMILKLDIEGHEWDVLNELPENILQQFEQLIIEFHALLNYQNKTVVLSVLNKLDKYYDIINVHGNNFSQMEYFDDQMISDVLEVTYLSKRTKAGNSCNTVFGRINEKCWPMRSEIYMVNSMNSKDI